MKPEAILKIILGAGCVLLLSFIIVSLITTEIPPENKETFILLIGIVGGSFTTIVGYYFGSSESSAIKNEVIKDGIFK